MSEQPAKEPACTCRYIRRRGRERERFDGVERDANCPIHGGHPLADNEPAKRGRAQAMATDELTAEQVEDMRLTALLRVDPMAGRVMALSGSHESLRADRDRLREERDKWQTDHGLLSDDYRDLSQDIDRLRQALETVQMHWSTLAAKDAEIQRLKKSDPTPWIRPENS